MKIWNRVQVATQRLSVAKRLTIAFAALAFGGVFAYQNCAEVQFIEPIPGGQKSTGTITSRIVVLKPSSSTPAPTSPAKILLVIDNSKSMAATQAKLRAALRSLLLPLKLHPVAVKIITTSTVASVPELEDQGFTVKVSGLDANTPISNEWRARFQMTTGDYFAGGYDVHYMLNDKNLFSIDASDAEFDAKIEAIKSRILTLSAALDGADREQPLCNTLLALYDKGPNQFFNRGDYGAVVVISDEDDGSRWHTFDTTQVRRDCRNRYTYGSIGNRDRPAGTAVDYTLNLWGVHFVVAYDQLNDGVAVPKTGGDNGGFGVKPSERAQVEGQTGSAVLACSEPQRERALQYARYLFPAPTSINVRLTSCEVRATWTALYGFGSVEENRCQNSFVSDGKTYRDLYEFFETARDGILVNGGCRRDIRSIPGYRGFSDFYIDGATDPNIVDAGLIPIAQHEASIKRALIARITDLFADDAFFHAAIIHKDQTCVGPNQSIGRRYLSFGAESPLASVMKTYSLCGESYSDVLDKLGQQIRLVVDQKIVLPTLEEQETIALVVLIRAGVRTELKPEIDYTVETVTGGRIIRFANQRLLATDSVELTIDRQN